MRFVVGGEEYDLTREQVELRMRGVEPEEIRKHVVELHGTVYPPKQVFGTVARRARTSFTTMEAQRVLTKLGFTCRTARNDGSEGPRWAVSGDAGPGGTSGPAAVLEAPFPEDPASRLASVEAQLATAMTAIQGLAARVAALESE